MDEVSFSAMCEAHDGYVKEQGVTTGVAVGLASGQVRSVMSELTKQGFSFSMIVKNLFILLDFIQTYGGDILKVVEAFKEKFGIGK